MLIQRSHHCGNGEELDPEVDVSGLVWGGRNHLATVRQASQGRGDVLRMAEGKEKRKSGSLMMMLSCRINLF